MVDTAEECAEAAAKCVGSNCAPALASPMSECEMWEHSHFPKCFAQTEFPMLCWNEHGASHSFWPNMLLLCKREPPAPPPPVPPPPAPPKFIAHEDICPDGYAMVDTAEECAEAAAKCVGSNCAPALASPMSECEMWEHSHFPKCFAQTEFPMLCWNEHGASHSFWPNLLLLCKREPQPIDTLEEPPVFQEEGPLVTTSPTLHGLVATGNGDGNGWLLITFGVAASCLVITVIGFFALRRCRPQVATRQAKQALPVKAIRSNELAEVGIIVDLARRSSAPPPTPPPPRVA